MSAEKELPKYRCHKEVWALKIKALLEDHVNPSLPMVLVFEDESYAPKRVSLKFVAEKLVTEGGYFIVYEDGYESFSPAAAFEAGYTLLENG